MKRLLWLFGGLLTLLVVSCVNDEVEDVSKYYFKPVENQEDCLPGDLQFRTAGGSFEVMFDTGQSWTATVQEEDGGWVHLSKAEGEAGINTLTLTIDPYDGADPRTASVLILARTMGKRIRITQNGKAQEQGKAARSVLIYLAAENSLSGFAMEDLGEMIDGAQDMPENNHVLVYVDDRKLPRIYEIAPDEKGVADTIRVEDYPTDLDSAAPETLAMALNYMKDNYEAEEYGLVMWSHGEGWVPGTTRFIGIDNNGNTGSNSGSVMSIGQLKDAIEQSVGDLEFIFFDACFMMTAEVAYELRNSCHYMIGSPCEIPGPGAPYQVTLPAMFDEDINNGRIAETYYQYYLRKYGNSTSTARYGAVLTTVDCTTLDAFAEVTAQMVKSYFTESTTVDSSNWVQYGFSKVIGGYPRTNMYLDMMQVMRDTLSETDYSVWEKAFHATVLSLHATDFWFSSSKGMCTLDVDAVGGLAITLPMLITNSKELEDLSQMEWYGKVWK